MCNLTTKTDKKTVTIYKVVYKKNGKYYAIFSGVEVKKGIVERQRIGDCHRDGMRNYFNYYSSIDNNYNTNMIGKSSGFDEENPARLLMIEIDEPDMVILKIKLSGEIWRGDALHIGDSVPNDSIVFAGSEIISFREV
jgi:hypothetical protein